MPKSPTLPKAPVRPIRLSPHSGGLPFRGGTLHIVDRPQLVDLVARLILGHYLHVELILMGDSTKQPVATPTMVQNACDRLASPANDGLRWRRDGWVFQMISWIAAKSVSHARTVSVPHMQSGKHGFDCLYLELSDSDVPTLTVCEDKATENPRSIISGEVFPEFESHEKGIRDSELQAELTSLLRQGRPAAEVDAIIQSVQWTGGKRYCATVTATSAVAKKPGKLYKDFETVVADPAERRTGNIFPVDELRDWMDAFCIDVVAALRLRLVTAPNGSKQTPA